MKKQIIILFLLVSFTNSVLAGFGVSPPIIKNHELEPGSIYEKEIKLKRSDSTNNLKVSINIEDSEIKDWLSIYPSQEFIFPQEEKETFIIVSINTPRFAKAKEYSGKIYINTSFLEKQGGVALNLGAIVNLDLMVTRKFDLNKLILIILIIIFSTTIIFIVIKKKKS